ncbi:Uncharacterized protein Fot_04687 [Forsythia ovata]|uniref:Uncharacterized protein n=1 Tax=Forsythia ovata TaxID=205694 RepID=A0ABD1XDB2_9LAMI
MGVVKKSLKAIWGFLTMTLMKLKVLLNSFHFNYFAMSLTGNEQKKEKKKETVEYWLLSALQELKYISGGKHVKRKEVEIALGTSNCRILSCSGFFDLWNLGLNGILSVNWRKLIRSCALDEENIFYLSETPSIFRQPLHLMNLISVRSDAQLLVLLL